MNFVRLIAAAFAAWLASIGIGYVRDILLADLYAEHEGVMRPAVDIEGRLPAAAGAMLLGFLVFSYAYAKGYEGGYGTQEGLRFGVIVGLLLLCFSVAWQYAMFPVSGRWLSAWAIDYIVEFALYGMIVGATYKPLPPLIRRQNQ